MAIVSIFRPSRKKVIEIAKSVSQRFDGVNLLTAFYSVRRDQCGGIDATDELSFHRVYLAAALEELDELRGKYDRLKARSDKAKSVKNG